MRVIAYHAKAADIRAGAANEVTEALGVALLTDGGPERVRISRMGRPPGIRERDMQAITS